MTLSGTTPIVSIVRGLRVPIAVACACPIGVSAAPCVLFIAFESPLDAVAADTADK